MRLEGYLAVAAVVVLPADPTGRALALVVRQLRAATRSGAVVVDLTATRHTSRGLRRALTVLHHEASRRGCTWTIRGALPVDPLR